MEELVTVRRIALDPDTITGNFYRQRWIGGGSSGLKTVLDNVPARAEVGNIILSDDCGRRRLCVSALRGRDGTHGVGGWHNVPRMLQSCQA